MKKVIVSPSSKDLIVRKPNGQIYKDNSEVLLTQDVVRALNCGDLVLVKEQKKSKSLKDESAE